MSIIDNRREESNEARMNEWNPYVPIRELFARAFDAGVNAQRDYQEAERQEAMDKARELYEAQRSTEPVAFMNVMPGSMITIINGRDY